MRIKVMDMPIYSFKNLVEDLEPYVPFPKEEISALLKRAFVLILLNATMGKLVQINYFGMFYKKFIQEKEIGNNQKGRVKRYPSRYTFSYKPYPFVRWFVAPEFAHDKKLYKQPSYYHYLDKLKDAFWYHSEKYDLDKFRPPFYNEAIKQAYLKKIENPGKWKHFGALR